MRNLFEWSEELAEQPRVDVGRASVHMYNMPDIDIERILGASSLLDIPIGFKARIISPYTSNFRRVYDLRSLLHDIIQDISREVMYINTAVARAVKDIRGGQVELLVAGYTLHSQSVERELLAANVACSVVKHQSDKETIQPVQSV
jgi:hypothetical protein